MCISRATRMPHWTHRCCHAGERDRPYHDRCSAVQVARLSGHVTANRTDGSRSFQKYVSSARSDVRSRRPHDERMTVPRQQLLWTIISEAARIRSDANPTSCSTERRLISVAAVAEERTPRPAAFSLPCARRAGSVICRHHQCHGKACFLLAGGSELQAGERSEGTSRPEGRSCETR